MGAVVLLAFRGVLLGLAGAVLVVGLRRWRRQEAVPGAVRWWMFAGALLGALVMVVGVVAGIGPLLGLPSTLTEVWASTRFILPLIVGVLAVALALLPVGRRPDGRSAVLARRTLVTFAPRGWLVALGAVIAVVLALTVAAGMASQPDEEGRWRAYFADAGVVRIGTGIYGWYYSVPALALLAALLVLVPVALAVIARPPLATDVAADTATRHWRARQVVRLATAAVLLHLSRILHSLSDTAAMHGGASTDDGWVVAYGRFAALEGPLHLAGQLTNAFGWACWFIVLLTALTTASRSTVKADPAAAESVR